MRLIETSIKTKVLLVIIAAVLAIGGIAAALIIDSRSRIADFHLKNAKTALQASLALLEQDNAMVIAGEVTLEQAQERAIAQLREFRYDDGEGYVAITDDVGFMVLHPVHEHLNQSDIWDLRDATGAYITRDAIRIAKEQEIGVNRYYFEHPITGETDIKTSAVGRFDPWGWTLIVGVFAKSVNDATSQMLEQAVMIMATMSALFLILAIAIGRSVSQPISALTSAMTAVAAGRHDEKIPYQNLQNECGEMARALAVFRDSAQRIASLQAEKEEAQRRAEQERHEISARLREEFGAVLQASNRGDFSQRVTTDPTDENLRGLANTLNQFVYTVDAGVSTVKNAMASMSLGQRPAARPEAFQGAFAEMLELIGQTAETMRNQSLHLEHIAQHDPLTGLPNRRYFESKLQEVCAQTDADAAVALLHVDLDRFKQINDTLGHGAGDEILKLAARWLRRAARPSDFVARIGGDEFVVLCHEDISETALKAIAADIVETLGRPHTVAGNVARFGASVGVAMVSGEDMETVKLQTNADLALYRAKKNGRNQFCFFSESIESEFVRIKKTGDEILRALENREFVPYYQPQVDAHTHQVVGVEALARWRHPERGIVPPIAFLPIAEELGVVGQIDAQIFEAAVEGLRRVNAAGGPKIDKLSVNVSFRRILDPSLMTAIDNIGGLDHRLAFELLEAIVFDEQDDAFLHQIDALKERGIEIEIDDFGSGRASITGLLKVAPHRLKVDRELIAPILEYPHQRKLIESILDIGRTLDIGIIAEGVETLEHADTLAQMQCETLQGYAFSRPLPEAELIEYLRPAAAAPALRVV